MIISHFGEIRQYILEELSLAEHDIYVAVAWITDKTIFECLNQKQKGGVDVTIILIRDEINKNNQFNYEAFIENGGKVLWDNHHHKFCIIDRKTVISGSYNWTYGALNRGSRENIIIIKEEENVISKFSSEFRLLKSQAQSFNEPDYQEDSTSIEVLEVYTVDEFKEKAYKLASQVQLNTNGKPYLLCIDTIENKKKALYMFRKFGNY